MKYKTLDWIGRIPAVTVFYGIVRATDTPATIPIIVLAVLLLAAQLGAIARCFYLGTPETSR